jgi:hypothetical protein
MVAREHLSAGGATSRFAGYQISEPPYGASAVSLETTTACSTLACATNIRSTS